MIGGIAQQLTSTINQVYLLTSDTFYGPSNPYQDAVTGDYLASESSGTLAGLSFSQSVGGLALTLSTSYVPGTTFTSTARFARQGGFTLDMIDPAGATYTWGWGVGSAAETFTVEPYCAAPEPPTAALLCTGILALLGLGLARRRDVRV